MNNKIRDGFVITVCATLMLFGAVQAVGEKTGKTVIIKASMVSAATSTIATSTLKVATSTSKVLSTRQRVWISALEWCESRGVPTAINPKDRDNTPSFGAFQFKPDTFAHYAQLLDLGDVLLMDRNAQLSMVEYMVLDPKTNWLQQFPDCVKNHIGFPPKS